MSLPEFHAEAALGPATGRYAGAAVFGASAAGAVSPMQQFEATAFPGRFGFKMRCCGFSTWLRRFVCTERVVSPFEQCECTRDYVGHPVILCRPPVLSPE